MRVVWTPEAQQDRADVWDYLAADDPRAAARMDALFSDAATKLAVHPMLGRSGKISGTRELIPHESYRLVYEICRHRRKSAAAARGDAVRTCRASSYSPAQISGRSRCGKGAVRIGGWII